MGGCWNRYTSRFQKAVPKGMRVRIPLRLPEMEHEVKCQSCGEKEATYHIKIPDYAGNAAPLRCDECMKVAVKSHEGVVVEKIEE